MTLCWRPAGQGAFWRKKPGPPAMRFSRTGENYRPPKPVKTMRMVLMTIAQSNRTERFFK